MMARLRECAIGLVPCVGVNASVATAFQCVTALRGGKPAVQGASGVWARPGVAIAIARLVSTAIRERRGTDVRAIARASKSANMVSNLSSGESDLRREPLQQRG